MRSNQYRSSSASIYMYIYWWVDLHASRHKFRPFPRWEFTAGSIWTYGMLIAKCSQISCRNYTGGFRRWPPATCSLSNRRSFDHHSKGNGYFVQKRVSKNEKKSYPSIDLKVMKTRNDCEIACDSVKHAKVVLHVGLCKEIFARKHTATHKPTSAKPLIVTTMAHIHTYIHTYIHPQES